MSMKLALVIPGFQSSPDDWCIPVFTNLARELSERLELHVFALRYPARHDRYDIGAVHVHSLGAGAFAGKRIPAFSLVKLWRDFLSAVAREHSRSPFRAVMGIWATESGWLATRAARRLALPSLVHLAGGELIYIPKIDYGNYTRGLAGRLVKRTITDANLLTSPSLPIRRKLETILGQSASRVRDWAPGVDTAMFSSRGRDNAAGDPFVFVSVGSLIPVKGHDLLIRSLGLLHRELPERDTHLRIVGDGPLRTVLSKLVSDLHLEGYVTLEGEVPHDHLPEVYRAVDAFVLGSWHEAQCMAALEAMSCALPWVAPPIGSLFDVGAATPDQPSGVIFNELNPVRVAEAMKRLVELSPGERLAYGDRARRTIVERYSLGTQTDRLLDLLSGLTEDK